jgi:hypothetical protein
MTARQWIDLVKDVLAGGSAPQELKGKNHPEILRKHLTIVHNYLVGKVAYPQALAMGDLGYLDSYAKTFLDVPILYDEERDEKYSELPSTYIPIPKNRGIRMIAPQHGQDKPFLYRDNNTKRIFSNLDVQDVYPEGRYYLERNKIYYSGLPYEMDVVLMKLVIPFDAFDDNDEVVFPTGYGKIVTDMVIQSMLGKPLEKFINDNNSNTK